MDTDLPALKGKLVTCIRMMAMEGLLDFNGHVSVRLLDDRLLINSRYSTHRRYGQICFAGYLP